MGRRKSRFLRKAVEPFTIVADATAENVLERMERISFQGRNLATARRIWETINRVNLRQNVLPTRERAHLVLEKGRDHAVRRVRLRMV